MADRHTDDHESSAKRRAFLKAVGAAGALSMGGMASGTGAASEHDVNLADEGLSSGDRIDPYLDGTISNETVLIPAGEYQWDGSIPTLSNATLRGHPDGVVLHRPSSDTRIRSTISYSGDATLENITIRGKSGSQQSRINLNGDSGSHLTLRNVNQPDGSVDYSDSYAHSGWNSNGSVTFDRCYFGDFGNATCYMEGQGGDATWRECVFENGQNAVRPPEGHDATLDGCVFIWNGSSNYWCEEPQSEPASSCSDCGGGCGRYARGIRVKLPVDRFELRRCRFYMGQGDISHGPCVHLRSSGYANESIIDDCRFYNYGDQPVIIAGGDWDDITQATNLRTGGPGAGLSDFSGARVGDWSNPDLSDVSVWHTAEGQREASVGAADPTPNVPSETGGEDGGEGGDEDEGDQDPFENRFVVMSSTADASLGYRFWVDGNVSLETVPDSDVVAENGDESISQSDALTVVTGSTGNEFGDAFAVDGEVLAFERTSGSSDWQLFDDGEDVTDQIPESLPADQDPLADRFAVMSTTPSESVSYKFWVDGDASLATDIDNQYAAESGDEAITEEGGYTCLTGSTGNEFGDAFECDGDVVAFQKTGGASEYQLLDDGEDVTGDIPAESPVEDGGGESENRLIVMSSTSQEALAYQFWVDGGVELDTQADDGTAAEVGDERIDTSGEYAVVTGSTGNEFGDAFLLDGDLVAFERTSGRSDYELLLGGEAITGDVPTRPPNAEPSTGTLFIDGTGSPDETSQYTFTVAEAVEYDPDQSTVEGDGLPWDTLTDSVDGTTATGIVGNGVDAYAITGELVDIDVRGPAEYRIEWS